MLDQSFDGSLLWDGTTKTFTPSESYKRDQMSPNMNEATTGAIDLIVGCFEYLADLGY